MTEGRDAQGRWVAGVGALSHAEGDWLRADAAASVHKLVAKAHAKIDKALDEVDLRKTHLELAADERKSVEGELPDDEEYEKPADQEDYEKRLEKSGREADKAAFATRDKLAKVVEVSGKHLDLVNAKINVLAQKHYGMESRGLAAPQVHAESEEALAGTQLHNTWHEEMSGEVAGETYAKADAIQSDLIDKHDALGARSDDLESAVSTQKDVESELSEDEEYEKPADQEDYEKRVEQAPEDSAKAVFAARDGLAEFHAAALAHLSAFNTHLASLD